eukprot:g30693.t1
MEGSLEDERRVESSLALRPRPLSIANDVNVTGSAANAPSIQSARPNAKESDLLLENKKMSLNPDPNPNSRSMELVEDTGKVFEGVLRAEGSMESQDIRDAFDSFCQGSIRVHLDKLKIIGVGFQMKLRESSSAVLPVIPLEEKVQQLTKEIEALKLALDVVARPFVYEVPVEELRSYGWEIDPATLYGPDGLVPDDDMYWRGSFSGKVANNCYDSLYSTSKISLHLLSSIVFCSVFVRIPTICVSPFHFSPSDFVYTCLHFYYWCFASSFPLHWIS